MPGRLARIGSQRASASVWSLAGLVLLSSLLAAAEPAETRTVTVRWRQPGEAAGFKIYTRHVDQPYAESIDVGLPEQVKGIFTYLLEVSNQDATYVSVSAYAANGTESPRSEEKLYLLPD